MNKLIQGFKKLTPYDHFLIFLIILCALKVLDVFLDQGTHAGLHFLLHGGLHFGISTGLFFAFRFALDKTKRFEHAAISTLLILLMVSHDDPNLLQGVIVLVFLYASKFLVKFQGQNVFNPVVFAIGAATLVGLILPVGVPLLDFSGIHVFFDLFGFSVPIAFVPIVLMLVFNVGEIRRQLLAFVFIGSLLLGGALIGAFGAGSLPFVLVCAFLGVAVVVEPKTAPIHVNEQIAYGIAAAAVCIGFLFLKVPNAMIMALMLANLVYFIYRRSGIGVARL